jgi:hypothetical protein
MIAISGHSFLHVKKRSRSKHRDAEGVWTPLETYIAEQSEADFTHGICPACMARLYPEIDPEP